MSIPPPTVAHGDMSADHDFFYVRPYYWQYMIYCKLVEYSENLMT